MNCVERFRQTVLNAVCRVNMEKKRSSERWFWVLRRLSLKSLRRGALKKLRQQITPHNVEKGRWKIAGEKGTFPRKVYAVFFFGEPWVSWRASSSGYKKGNSQGNPLVIFSCRSSSPCELRKIKYFAYPFLHQPPLKKPSFTLFYFLPRSTKRISLLVW